MSYEFYKVLHFVGIFFLFFAMGGLTLHVRNGGTKDNNPSGKIMGMTHGIALIVILVAGFGMLAKLSIGFPTWVLLKLVIWLIFGASIAFVRRMPHAATAFWIGFPLLGAFSAWLALTKPF